MSSKTALVMRATGRQGMGVIHHLSKAGWRIHALVADASSDRALALKSFSSQITLYQGTWRDPPTIEAAIRDCQAFFLNQLTSPEGVEVQEARLVLELAKAAGVQHVVFPSTLPLNNPSFREDLKDSVCAPSISNKADVEDVVRSSGLTWTLLRPGMFFTNFLPPLVYFIHPDIKEGKITNSYSPDCIMTLVDPHDIGAFVAAAFEDPAKFGSQIITVVSERVRFDDMVTGLSDAIGEIITAVYRTAEETTTLKDDILVASQIMCVGLDNLVDMVEVRSWGVPLTTYKQFMEKHKDELPRIATA
jgi:uncharacterized protein YbjT (DUF2867 family)